MIRPGLTCALGRCLACALTGLWLVLATMCPSAAALPDWLLHDGHHSRWTVPDGAPDIKSIAQDKNGYLWLGTDHGLVAFDGVSFKTYHSSESDWVSTRDISVVSALPDGGLWIGYEEGGASLLQDGKLVTYSGAEGLSQGAVRAFAKDKSGTVWAATQYGLVRLRGSRWQNVGEHWGYPWAYPDNLFVDSRGTLWTSTRKGLSFLRKEEEQLHLADPHRLENVDFSEAPDGTVWLATVTGTVSAITNRTGDYTPRGTSLPFRSEGIHVARDGALWITTVDHGVYQIANPEAPRSARQIEIARNHFSARDGLSSDFAFDVLQGREGEMWVATAKGLDQFRWAPFAPIPLLSGSTYVSAAITSRGDLLLASDRFAAVRGGVAVPVSTGPKRIECIYRDPSGHMWVGSGQQLFRQVGSQFIPYPPPAGFDHHLHDIQAMTMDRDGALWVSYLMDGVYRLKNRVWQRSGGLPGLSTNPAVSMFTDAEGRLWFGYPGDHLVSVDAGRLVALGTTKGINIGTITAIAEIQGHIWIGGTNGLQFEDHGHFQSLKVAAAEQLRGVSGAAASPNGDLWLNTAAGVVQVPASEERKALNDPTYPVHAAAFTYLDGLTGRPDQLHHLPTLLSGRDGKLYFAVQGSLLLLDPAKMPRNGLPPPVWIESVNADGTLYRNPSALTLRKNTHSLSIDYTATSLLVPQRVHFQYKLDGIDANWQDAGTRREAIYSRLPPGKYRFHVIASNNDGVWNRTGASLSFLIPPAFVQSMTFRAIEGFSIVALLWSLYVFRLHQVTHRLKESFHARVSEREQIARDLHDTFLQGVQGVFLSFHTATKHFQGSDQARGKLDEAFRQSAEVMQEGRALILNLRNEATEVDDLARTLSALGLQFSKGRHTGFTLAVSGQVCDLNPIVRDEIYRIAREAITNAFRHAAATQIEVDLQYGKQDFLLRVRDDGIGIDPDILSVGSRANHWGLPGMRERAQTIGGEMNLWSRLNAGTEVELRLPMSVATMTASKRIRFLAFTNFLGKRGGHNA